MIRNALILLLLIPLHTLGKETKKITINSLFPPYREVFYVLKSDTAVRDGEYKLTSEGKTIIQGYYKMGLKDSLWTSYNRAGQLRIKGCYSQNNRIGVWEYYNDKEEVEQKFDFTDNVLLLYRTQLANHPFRIISGSDTIHSILDRPPLYLGGQTRINEFINSQIGLPLHKSTDKYLGTVFVEFLIDSTGRTSEHHILKGLFPGSNAEAMRVVKLIPDEWIPGMYQGRFVTVNYVIPIVFNEKMFENYTIFP